ncbi:tRNA 2-selenouridine(34) synthase MnmH [Pseudobacteriovorax antillogorgiicola]|nr:tRNA 2-selenouridine(34) synthase MnmH [Pseudobacteriovorax antillogorgiicola]
MEPATFSTKTPSKTDLRYFAEDYPRDLPIVDLRSPREFALGHIPGAINLPLFDDDERHQVGWTYKQVSKVDAVQLGLELLAQKMDHFLDELLAHERGRGLVLHCWRGGMRSQSVASLMRSLGCQASVLEGGYKQYRRDVLAQIECLAGVPFLVLMGRTGVGKTELLQRSGVPYMDFEAYAHHRGSAFGDLNQAGPVPTQQNFENQIAEAARDKHDCGFCLVEIESYFAHLNVPNVLRKKMLTSPVVILSRDRAQRIEHILEDYIPRLTDDMGEQIKERIQEGLAKHFRPSLIAELMQEVDQQNLAKVVGTLLDIRYDPLYDKKLVKHRERVIAEFDVSNGYQDAIHFVQQYKGR